MDQQYEADGSRIVLCSGFVEARRYAGWGGIVIRSRKGLGLG